MQIAFYLQLYPTNIRKCKAASEYIEVGGIQQWRSHWGGKGGRVSPLTAKKKCQKSGKRGKNQEKLGKKSGKKRKNREVSFTLPLLTDTAGYATGIQS